PMLLQRSQSVPASVAPNTKGYLKISQTFQVALSRFRLSPHAQRPPETLFQTFRSDTPQQNAARTHVQTAFSLRRFIPRYSAGLFPAISLPNKKAPTAADAPSFTGSPIF
ncbi:TPA: hypothetical protein ACSC3R_002077, partial [Neisseria meningitidis]